MSVLPGTYPRLKPFLRLLGLALCAAGTASAQQSATVQLPDSIAAPGTQVLWIKKVQQFCEGPAVDLADGTLYFTEQRDNNTPDWPIWKINPANPSDTGSRWVTSSNQSNGLFVDFQGRVIAAQKGKIVRYAKNGSVDSVLATSGKGATFGQANDFSMAKSGAFYFTDLTSQVFYVDVKGVLKVAATGVNSANGIEWIEEENAVYVQAGSNRRFDVSADGSLTNGKTFFAINGPDGCEVDSHGNFYLCSYTEGIVHVVNGKGIEIGKITFNMASGPYDARGGAQGNICNCHFGGAENKTLYCTGDGGAYSLQLKIPGRKWPAALPTGILSPRNLLAKPLRAKAYRTDGRFWSQGMPADLPGTEGARGHEPRLPLFQGP
ncbi:MAG: gluconolactonase [Fibrobacteres bacterium]|nr:gluconolactonase [Fibrobacterota bacterium]